MKLRIPIYSGNNRRTTILKVMATMDKNILLSPKKHQILDKWEDNKAQQVFLFISVYLLIPWLIRRISLDTFKVYKVESIRFMDNPSDVRIYIDDYLFYSTALNIDHGIFELGRNEGFNTTQEFLDHFSKLNEAVIVHWTRLSYKNMIFDQLP